MLSYLQPLVRSSPHARAIGPRLDIGTSLGSLLCVQEPVSDQHRCSPGTPNGQMVSILLEELKAVYPKFEYEVIPIDFGKNEQKEE